MEAKFAAKQEKCSIYDGKAEGNVISEVCHDIQFITIWHYLYVDMEICLLVSLSRR